MRDISETCYGSRLNHLAQKSDANCVSVLAKQTLKVVIKTDRVEANFSTVSFRMSIGEVIGSS